MFIVRCGVVFLALLACTQASQKCTVANFGQQSGYQISFAPADYYYKSIDLHLPYEKAGCYDPVGSWVRVCAEDDEKPGVWFYNEYKLHIERNGAYGYMTVESGGFCKEPPTSYGLGAARPTPEVVPVNGKNPK